LGPLVYWIKSLVSLPKIMGASEQDWSFWMIYVIGLLEALAKRSYAKSRVGITNEVKWDRRGLSCERPLVRNEILYRDSRGVPYDREKSSAEMGESLHLTNASIAGLQNLFRIIMHRIAV